MQYLISFIQSRLGTIKGCTNLSWQLFVTVLPLRCNPYVCHTAMFYLYWLIAIYLFSFLFLLGVGATNAHACQMGVTPQIDRCHLFCITPITPCLSELSSGC